MGLVWPTLWKTTRHYRACVSVLLRFHSLLARTYGRKNKFEFELAFEVVFCTVCSQECALRTRNYKQESSFLNSPRQQLFYLHLLFGYHHSHSQLNLDI
jgi:hypothetical protein